MAPPFHQFLFPELTTTRKVVHTQHARSVMLPTATVTVPSGFESASQHDPFDSRTIDTGVLTTFNTYTKPTTTSFAEPTMTTFTSVTTSVIPPSFSTFSSQAIPIVAPTLYYELTATFDTSTRPNTIAVAMSTEAATVVPTPTQHTDLSAINAQNLQIDKKKMELFLAIFGSVSLVITLAVLLWCLTGSRRWRRRSSTRPVEQMEMARNRRDPCAISGYHAALRQPNGSNEELGSRSLRGSALGIQSEGPIVYPSPVWHDRYYGPGYYDTDNRKFLVLCSCK